MDLEIFFLIKIKFYKWNIYKKVYHKIITYVNL